MDHRAAIGQVIESQWQARARTVISVLLLSCLLMVGIASAVPITENTDLGWQTLINNSYITGEVSHNNTYLAVDSFTGGLVVENETLIINASANNALEWKFQAATPVYGNLFVGKLYPAGHVKTRWNMSVVPNGTSSYVSIYNGGLSRVDVYGYVASHRVYLKYYASNGTFISSKNFQVVGTYVDFSIEQFPNGTATVSNNQNPLQNISAKYHEDRSYSYNFTSSNTFRISRAILSSTTALVRIYNFEESVPKKQITVLSKNNEFAFGQDGPRANYNGATEWLKAHNQSETIWGGVSYWSALTADQKADILDMVNNRSFEVGIHFTDGLSARSWAEAINEINIEIPIIASDYGHMPVSFCSLGNNEDVTHASNIWANWSVLWRNMPNSNQGILYSSIYAMYGVSTISQDDNTGYWKTSCQYGAFHPVYTHSVANPLNESSSVDTQNFTAIMDCYNANNVTIVPYGKWYYESVNTVQPITDVLLDTYGSHFSIDSQGYNASTRIIDPFGERIWYSETPGMMVITEIDNGAAETNLTIRNNATDPVIRQANASIVPSSGKILVNVKEWDSGSKTWNESASDHAITTIHQIGDFPANTNINVKKNGAMYGNFTTNSTGWMNFTYSDGYSDVMFEAEVGDPIASFTPSGPVTLWWPNGQAFTDTSTGSPTAWTWSFGDGTTGTEQNPYHWWMPGLYQVQLNASTSTAYSLNSTWVVVLP